MQNTTASSVTASSNLAEAADLAAQAVAFHDSLGISPALANAVKAANAGINDAIFKLEKLEQERESWEAKELSASHQRLYSLLTQCYEFYLAMKTDKSSQVREQMKKGLETFIGVRGYKFLSSSHDMNRVVKSIFGVDRRRVSAYSLALRSALAAGGVDKNGKSIALPPSQLASWLEQQGGVEEVRLGCKNKGMTAKERAEAAKTALSSSVLMTLKADPKAVPFDTDDVDKMMVLVATYRPTGELEISAVVKNDAAVRAALAAHYSENKAEVQAAADKAENESAPQSATAAALVLSQQSAAK